VSVSPSRSITTNEMQSVSDNSFVWTGRVKLNCQRQTIRCSTEHLLPLDRFAVLGEIALSGPNRGGTKREEGVGPDDHLHRSTSLKLVDVFSEMTTIKARKSRLRFL